jgi:hypothetical protein
MREDGRGINISTDIPKVDEYPASFELTQNKGFRDGGMDSARLLKQAIG